MNTQMLHHHRTSSAYSYFTAGCLTPEHPLTNKIRSEATILLISGGKKGEGGHIVISCEKTTAVTLEGPQIIFFPPNACFCIKSERPTEYLSCHFNIENPALAQIDLQQLHRQHTEIETSQFHPLPLRAPLIQFQQLLQHYLNDRHSTRHQHKLKTYELFFLLRHYYAADELARLLAPITGQNLTFKHFVLNHFTEYPSIEDFARMAHLNLDTFKRTFRKEFKQPVHRWLNERKKVNILHDLKYTQLPLQDIATRYRFSSLAYLSTFCKQHLGKSPSEIRKMS